MDHGPVRRPIRIACMLLLTVACPGGNCFAGTASYRSIVLGDNPIVYYEFDEVSGSTLVNSATTGSLYDGTFNTSQSITVNQPSFAGGGTSYRFAGGCVVASGLTESLTEWTVEAWVNYDASKSAASNFFSNDQEGWNDDVLIGIGPEDGTKVPAGNVGAVHQGNGGSVSNDRDFAGAPLAAGTWHHIAVTGSTTAGELALFIDGVFAASDTSLINGVTLNGVDGLGSPSLIVGASRTDGLRPDVGLLDELAIYDYVLTPTQLTAHATVTPVPEPAGMTLLVVAAGALGLRRGLRRERRSHRGHFLGWLPSDSCGGRCSAGSERFHHRYTAVGHPDRLAGYPNPLEDFKNRVFPEKMRRSSAMKHVDVYVSPRDDANLSDDAGRSQPARVDRSAP
jgi:hypothetical protein